MNRHFKLGDMRAKMPMRIRLVLFAFLFAVPVLLLALLQFQRDSHRIHTAATAVVDRAADALVRRLEQDLAGAEAVARTIGAVDTRQPGGAAACSLALKRAVDAAGPRIDNYMVAAATGQVLCSGQAVALAANVAAGPHVQQALKKRQPALLGFTAAGSGGQESLQLVVPILDAGDRRVTALAIAAFTSGALVSGLPPDGDMPLTLSLFDRDGVLVSRAPGSQAVPLAQPPAQAEPFRRWVGPGKSTAELADLDGVSRLSTSRPVQFHGDTVLWVMSGVDVRALDAATLAAGARDLGIVLLLAAVVAGVAFFATRTLVLQRYHGLFSVVADVAVGNYSSRVAVIVQDDVTAVEVAFNGMMVAVEADRNELATANRALVEEIARREASESALAARELELEDAKRIAGLGSWSVEGEGSVQWSRDSLAIFGRDSSPQGPAAGEQAQLLTPESLATMQAGLRRVVATGLPCEVELEVIRPDGTRSWVVARGQAVRDADAVVRGVRGTLLDITERKLAELAVQRSQQQLRHLIDGLSPSIFVALLTPQGSVVEVNQSPLAAAGVQAQDVLGMLFVDTPWWRGSPQAKLQLRSAMEGAAQGRPSRYEVQTRGRQNEPIDIDFSLQPLRDESGNVIFLIASAVVITERKVAEAALRESESVFRALAESMPQIVWMADPDGMNIYFNQRWTDYSGLTLQESSGAGWLTPFHPDDQQRATVAWALATTTASTYMLECRLRRADGAYRWWLMRGEPEQDATGAVVKWVGTCTDVDDMKLAELEISRANAELKQQQTELRVLFDLMPALIMFKDTEDRILRINRYGAKAAGHTVEEIEGRLTSEVYPEASVQGHVDDLEVIRSGNPILGTVQKIRDRHGNPVWIQRDRVPYRDADGKVIGIVLLVQDITERKRDQDALRDLNTDLESRVRRRTNELTQARSLAEEASRAKSDFLAAMSHEIRTPMTGLLGLMELLQLSDLDDEQHSTLVLARESGSSLLSMIDDILDFSKIEANRLELNLVASSVKAIVETACRLHSQVASSKNLSLSCDVSPEISPLLAVDSLRLGQILNNFLNNAIKFTEHGTIHVRVDVTGRRGEAEDLRFVVRDTGIGMTRQQLGRLFEPFAQADAATSTRYGGTGLGLVIARRLAELMGGSVEIDSEAGRGTTLTLRVSLEACEAAATQPAPPTARQELESAVAGRRAAPSIQDAETEGTLLLVADDHPTNRVVLVRQLASLGYAAQAAVDGMEALALWRSGRFAAVITDCNMPRMNGYELAVAIRDLEQHGGLQRSPIIACTANALQSARDLCIGAGMDDCLVKPADLARVSALLDRWVPLERARASRPAATSPAPQPRRPAPSAEGLLDMVLLAEISGGNATAQAQFVAEFRRANELDATALRLAACGHDFTPVVSLAHRIKGASLMMGATLLSAVCGRIETAGAASDRAGLSMAMASFEAELLRLNNYLDTLSAP